ncbi:hypothetical protein C2845_PM11G22830 [Panicum miliaceum]|uniref:Uncharacterized protein n=1 Tax=Panicum miliaceum TaxID=4540 RepID=A0A3L6RTI2_PANMI|nr:hypothetical protein C2845_PM11G22830 [Panicum miliaceum]
MCSTLLHEWRPLISDVENESGKVDLESAKVDIESAKVQMDSVNLEESAKVRMDSVKLEKESAKCRWTVPRWRRRAASWRCMPRCIVTCTDAS